MIHRWEEERLRKEEAARSARLRKEADERWHRQRAALEKEVQDTVIARDSAREYQLEKRRAAEQSEAAAAQAMANAVQAQAAADLALEKSEYAERMFGIWRTVAIVGAAIVALNILVMVIQRFRR